jgi:hypothetical protein
MNVYKLRIYGWEYSENEYLVHEDQFTSDQFEILVREAIHGISNELGKKELHNQKLMFEFQLKDLDDPEFVSRLDWSEQEVKDYKELIQRRANEGVEVQLGFTVEEIANALITRFRFKRFKFQAEVSFDEEDRIGHTGPIKLDV